MVACKTSYSNFYTRMYRDFEHGYQDKTEIKGHASGYPAKRLVSLLPDRLGQIPRNFPAC